MRTAKSGAGRWLAQLLGSTALALTGALSGAGAAAPEPGFHADFEGVWEPAGGPDFDPDTRAIADNAGRPSWEMRDAPPYTPAYLARYDRLVADIRKGLQVEAANATCLPQGMPRIMVINYPLDILVERQRTVMLFEPLGQRRVIDTDGRGHTDPAQREPTFSGESIGHWEGDTLVVDTVGLRDDMAFDLSLAPHSDAMHIVERLRRVGEMLEDQFTVEDPKAFTRPWVITRSYKRHPGMAVKEFACENAREQFSFAMFDNSHDVMLDGVVRNFQWTNPHSWIQLTVAREGKPVEYAIELGSSNNYARRGWSRASLKPGDHIMATVHLRKDGTAGASLVRAVKADGTVLSY